MNQFKTEYEQIFYEYVAHAFDNVRHNVEIDGYEIDFVVQISESLTLLIEIDGAHHRRNYEHRQHDKIKNKRLCELGYAMIRIANKNVRNRARLKHILTKIKRKLKKQKIKPGDCLFYYD